MMKNSIDGFNKVFTYVQDSATDKERNGTYKDGSYMTIKMSHTLVLMALYS